MIWLRKRRAKVSGRSVGAVPQLDAAE